MISPIHKSRKQADTIEQLLMGIRRGTARLLAMEARNDSVFGYGSFDALHLAASELAGADVSLSPDDQFPKYIARKTGNPRIPV